jgi:hypothetical protein
MTTMKDKAFATGLLAFALLGAPNAGRIATGFNPTAMGQETVKKAANEVGDKAEDVKDETVKGAVEVGDKAEDVKDETVKGSKKVAHKTGEAADKTVKVSKKAGNEIGDKAEDVGDQTAKKSKDVAGWFKRTWKKIF